MTEKPTQTAFVTLQNSSAKSIIALTTVWTITPIAGKPKRIIYSSDSFLTPKMTPVAESHTRLLLGPTTLTSEELVSKLGAKGYIGAQRVKPSSRVEAELTTADKIRVDVDMLILADGEVIGPDTQHSALNLLSRKAAAVTVSHQVRSALEVDRAAALLEKLATTLHKPSDKPTRAELMEGNWSRNYARQLQRVLSKTKLFEASLAFLEKLPQSITLYRQDGAPIQ